MSLSYSLTYSYAGDALINGFNFFNETDPSSGFVAYQSREAAYEQGLYSVDPVSDVVTLRVDTTNTYATDGSDGYRPSIRIESKEAFNHGLIIGDFAHMPGSVCGSWPAFWMYGPDWPESGEIDIIEGANTAVENLMSGHTASGCTLPSTGGYTGTQGNTDCTSPGDNGNIGCNYTPPDSDTSTYGDTFNAVGGGIYAVEWTSDAIKIWHFPRTAIPTDITSKTPDPTAWGEPQSIFGGSSCDVDTFFNDMSIVINMDLCGAYAANVWGVTDTCDSNAATCNEWVAQNPSALENVYWEINSIDVYQKPEIVSSSSSAASLGFPSRTVTLSGIFGNSSTVAPASTGLPTAATTADATTTPAGVSVSSTNTAVIPSSTAGLNDPAAIGDFTFLGCFGSNSSYPTFNIAGSDAAMTPEVCVGLCASNKYAGVYDTSCYCADDLDALTQAIPDTDQCDVPCPGDASESCGGLAPWAVNGTSLASRSLSSFSRLHRRAAPAQILLTMYANLAVIPDPPAAPGMGGGADAVVTAHVTSTVVSTITSTVTYVSVCSTNPAILVTLEYCTTWTVTGCGCAHDTTPAVAMSTMVAACDACGASGESSVTLTVPAAVCTTAAVTTAAVTIPVVPASPTGGNTTVPVPTATGLVVVAAAGPGVIGMAKEFVSVAAIGSLTLALALVL
ncbi:putative endo- -beta- protein [Phaeoacremonium minimum UCRPA7]|uniref:Putative endo--beta-protein n=1 Tax=Phaeoacremonium minimum (strain UCR-PA7) TaxID=1286976 RepID=R8BE89_PHAM7|nr:putative endo- -beta- protein [Phaeoacremonium minimum UCRPA7]EON97590.1 putative endo- -beta- protein [Phaeoacremonium minimum UCRPA7]